MGQIRVIPGAASQLNRERRNVAQLRARVLRSEEKLRHRLHEDEYEFPETAEFAQKPERKKIHPLALVAVGGAVVAGLFFSRRQRLLRHS